MQKLSPTN